MYEEGKIKILAPKESLRKSSEAFFNPEKKFDRDISIEVLRILVREKYLPENFKFLDMLTGVGAYGLRVASEFECEAVLNDLNKKALEYAKKNLEINKDVIKGKVNIVNFDALRIAGKFEEKFDYIDIDPFGSPVKFLFPAFLLIRHEGIISVTATDTAPLYGTYKIACIRKYGSIPLKTYESHEIGLRILIKRVVEIASIFDFGIEILLSYWHKHIYRVFFRVLKGKNNANKSIKKIKYFDFEDGWKFYEDPKGFGPIWAGEIWKKEIAIEIGKKTILKELEKEGEIKTEENIFYDVHGICHRYKIKKAPSFDKILSEINKRGAKVSKTIFSRTGIRIEGISFEELLKIVRGF